MHPQGADGEGEGDVVVNVELCLDGREVLDERSDLLSRPVPKIGSVSVEDGQRNFQSHVDVGVEPNPLGLVGFFENASKSFRERH